ncbi:class III lanthionine synthetase LanKC [Kitasatospora paracochleata]|uniref:Serine/threonine protein kinase n=1 Tax=Kitasatospora paracochleata TaxID=58354 RepID=A0ABT1JAN8_9ACTN|nr:class III lanthionine synthetase LanKC [Kitasatospora paracochleata]MCP2314448.1 serine/threonine protein kinase [Kitasatospora paracochleata]
MDMRYEAYSYADRLFYDSPVRWAAREEFPAAGEPAPPGWVRTVREVWVGFQPGDVVLPEQGWKIHVSATLENAPRILDTVRTYCFEHRIAFKFLRSPALVQTQNAKYASRGSSGKFLTLYPVGEDELTRCLNELDTALDGAPGPYILSDLRWRKGPLYLRYGAFVELLCRDDDGELVLAFREPDGRLRPDVRRAVFEVPEWAPVPAVLRQALADAGQASVDAFPYTVESALHFSNGGGIYLARPTGGGDQVVLKEGRPYAGLDQRGEDAVERLGREYATLRRLEGVAEVPAALGHLTAWEHHFLVQEYVDGEPLHRWFGRNYPLVHPDPDEETVADYREKALEILAGVERGLRAIHRRGIVFGDLHPRNLIVRPDGRVTFIDFELASPVDDFKRPALGAAGFAAPAGLTGPAVDEYALDALRLWMFMPLLPLTALSPGKADALARAARARFALPPGIPPAPGAQPDGNPAEPEENPDEARRQRPHRIRPQGARPPGARPRTYRPDGSEPTADLDALLDGDPARWPRLRDGLAAAITASATPDRTDRLFPGDPGQFTHDGLGLSYGAAGVLWALHSSGAGVDPEHVRWLEEAVTREPCRPGLFIGAHGVAYVLDMLGRRQPALDLLERLRKDDPDAPGPDLSGGLAGIGLTQLHFAERTGDRALRDAALDTAERAVDKLGLTRPDAATAPPGSRAGLLHGATGTALLLLRLHRATGDTALLDLAGTALERDLSRCVTAEDGTLQVDDGTRVLPYLETGSAGIAVALHAYLRHRPDSPLADRPAPIRAAAEPEFIVQSGLFNGRAGLIALLALVQGDGREHAEVIRRHIRRLAWHVIPYRGLPAFPGEQLLRLSMDLATGTAGVLAALAAVHDGAPALPFWPDTVPPRPEPRAGDTPPDDGDTSPLDGDH